MLMILRILASFAQLISTVEIVHFLTVRVPLFVLHVRTDTFSKAQHPPVHLRAIPTNLHIKGITPV